MPRVRTSFSTSLKVDGSLLRNINDTDLESGGRTNCCSFIRAVHPYKDIKIRFGLENKKFPNNCLLLSKDAENVFDERLDLFLVSFLWFREIFLCENLSSLLLSYYKRSLILLTFKKVWKINFYFASEDCRSNRTWDQRHK